MLGSVKMELVDMLVSCGGKPAARSSSADLNLRFRSGRIDIYKWWEANGDGILDRLESVERPVEGSACGDCGEDGRVKRVVRAP